jgi:hypothetical protein
LVYRKRKVLKTEVLCPKSFDNNYNKEFSSADESDDEVVLQKWSPIDCLSVETPLKTPESVDDSHDVCLNSNTSDSDLQKTFIDHLLHLFSLKLHLSLDFIHERYIRYSNQTQSERSVRMDAMNGKNW